MRWGGGAARRCRGEATRRLAVATYRCTVGRPRGRPSHFDRPSFPLAAYRRDWVRACVIHPPDVSPIGRGLPFLDDSDGTSPAAARRLAPRLRHGCTDRDLSVIGRPPDPLAAPRLGARVELLPLVVAGLRNQRDSGDQAALAPTSGHWYGMGWVASREKREL